MNTALIKCSFCSFETSNDVKFCPKCGNPIVNQSATDKIIYEDENVTITKTRYRSFNTIYAMKDITSVSLTEEVPARIIPIIIWSISVIHLIWGLGFISSSLFNNRLVDSFIIALIGYIVNKFYKDHYYVTITNNSQQINTIKSTSKAYINIIIEALNQAIILRG